MESTYVHESACVDVGAKIGRGVKVWHFCHVSRGAIIGDEVSIGQNVFVASRVKIGDRCKIQNNVSLYDDVSLESDVFCGPSMVFTNVYNPRAHVSRKHEYRKTIVRRGATLGANCTIVCGVEIGEFAFIGAGAVVKKDVKPYSVVVGVPSRQVGWMDEFGEKLDLPLIGSGSAICRKTGCIYKLSDGLVTKVPGTSEISDD